MWSRRRVDERERREAELRQSTIVLGSEGDAWHARNKDKSPSIGAVGVLQAIIDHKLWPKKVLEVGCGNGWRLKMLQRMYDCEIYGIEPSAAAVEEGKKLGVEIDHGTAEDFLGSGSFDLIIFGFCFYLFDRDVLPLIIWGTDNALEDQGHLIIHDFHTDRPYSRPYAHDVRLRSYKMDYSRLFTGNPAYRLIEQRIFGTVSSTPIDDDDRVVVNIIKKDLAGAWPLVEEPLAVA